MCIYILLKLAVFIVLWFRVYNLARRNHMYSGMDDGDDVVSCRESMLSFIYWFANYRLDWRVYY